MSQVRPGHKFIRQCGPTLHERHVGNFYAETSNYTTLKNQCLRSRRSLGGMLFAYSRPLAQEETAI
jgi:hypothetical protein